MSEPGAFNINGRTYHFDTPGRVVLLGAQWHDQIVSQLIADAAEVLRASGIEAEVMRVPGTFELPMATAMLLEENRQAVAQRGARPIEGVICFGTVVRGDTPHFEYISSATAHAIANLAAQQATPVLFGVLTTNTLEQAEDRTFGKHSRKGQELGIALLETMAFKRALRSA
ncbi:MAG: 6,7-dimethyl-8-ribityllumazine synthase [Bacteroidia bacterium]|nr:MAG: 6,7-dimethyl-8-ribityllumazine synthase [Bacteroidia bacterium]